MNILISTYKNCCNEKSNSNNTCIGNHPTMKKKITRFVIILVSLCMIIPIIYHANVNAEESNTGCTYRHAKEAQENPEIVAKFIDNDGNQVYVYSDGATVTKNGDSFIVMIPEYASEYEAPATTLKTINIGTIWAVISTALTACTIIEWTFGANPCEIAYKYLLQSLGANAKTGKYQITGTYHAGYIPGCEPRNSLPCNSGYYEYQFVAV